MDTPWVHSLRARHQVPPHDARVMGAPFPAETRGLVAAPAPARAREMADSLLHTPGLESSVKPELMSAVNPRSCPQTALHFLGTGPSAPPTAGARSSQRHRPDKLPPSSRLTGPSAHRQVHAHTETPPLPKCPPLPLLPSPPTPNPHLQAPNSSLPLRNKFRRSSM